MTTRSTAFMIPIPWDPWEASRIANTSTHSPVWRLPPGARAALSYRYRKTQGLEKTCQERIHQAAVPALSAAIRKNSIRDPEDVRLRDSKKVPDTFWLVSDGFCERLISHLGRYTSVGLRAWVPGVRTTRDAPTAATALGLAHMKDRPPRIGIAHSINQRVSFQ